MRGRLPSGPEYVDQVPGSTIARDRARAVLETMNGSCRVLEACARLEISEPRFDQLRKQGVEALVQSLEPRRAGRPPRTPSSADERIRELEDKVADLELRVKLAQARAEIALVLPNAVHEPKENAVAPAVTDAGKKTIQPRRQRGRPQARAPASRKTT